MGSRIELASQLILSGDAEQICQAQLQEAQARQQLAYHLLGSRYQHQLRGLHGWLRLPSGVSPDELALRAEQAGVLGLFGPLLCPGWSAELGGGAPGADGHRKP